MTNMYPQDNHQNNVSTNSSTKQTVIALILAWISLCAITVFVTLIVLYVPKSDKDRNTRRISENNQSSDTTVRDISTAVSIASSTESWQSSSFESTTLGEPTIPPWARPQTEPNAASVHHVALLYGALGPVMVLHEQQWGFVCGNEFMLTANGCRVVCAQLGYRHGVRARRCEAPNFNITRIWLDVVICNGDELDVSECQHGAWGEHGCGLDDLGACSCCEDTPTCNVDPANQCPTQMECYRDTQRQTLQPHVMCDGNWDCQAGEDESCQVCFGNVAPIRCSATGTCILNQWLCDGISDCPSGEDESHSVCHQYCDADSFMCFDRTCITSSMRCDFRYDCDDHSDELNCFSLRAIGDVEVPLLYYPSSSSYVPICYQDFPTGVAHEICRSLGFGQASDVSYIVSSQVDESGEGFANIHISPLNTGDQSNHVYHNATWDTQYISSEHGCPNNEVVHLQCSFEQCGTRHKDYSDNYLHIMEGEDASLGMWPWQVLVKRYNLNDLTSSACGGILLNHEWVLTSAHCLVNDNYNASDIRLRLGSLRENSGGAYMHVQELILHEEYNEYGFRNDVALLRLENPIEYSPTIRPVCLADDMYDIHSPDVLECYVTGWGDTVAGTLSPPEVLQQLRVDVSNPITPSPSCERDDIMCYASLAQRSTCQGDSGGGLVCRDRNNVWTVVGLITFGNIGCGVYSGVTLVSYHLDWIQNHMETT